MPWMANEDRVTILDDANRVEQTLTRALNQYGILQGKTYRANGQTPYWYAECSSEHQHAIGIGAGWRADIRKRAAKLALGLVLAAQADSLEQLQEYCPMVEPFCNCQCSLIFAVYA